MKANSVRTGLSAAIGVLALAATGVLGAGTSLAAPLPAGTAAPILVHVADVGESGRQSEQRDKPFRHPDGQAELDREKADPKARAQAPATNVQTAPAPAATTPTPGTGFDGISDAESFCGCYPPDGAVGVGPHDVVAAVNTAFKVWDTSGVNLLPASSLSGLFAPNANCLPNISDPSVQYDPAAGGHFTIEALTFDGAYNSSLCVAVSTTSDPTAAYNVYGFTVTPANDLMDFPQLAIGSDAIYVAANQFQNGATFAGARVYAFNKAQMYAGIPAASVFHDVGNNSVKLPADTLYPAKGVTVANTMYFLAADNNAATGNNISLWKWNSPFGANLFTLQGGVGVTTYAQPPAATQPGGTTDTGDVRNLGAAYFGGTVYGVHTIGCNPGGGVVPCLQWYQLGNVDASPSLAQQGILGGTNQSRYYPTLSTDKSGDLLMGYAYASTTEYPGVRYTGRLTSDALGTLETEGALKAGEAYTNGARYGDFAGEQLGPDGCTVWHLEEYAKAGALWGTWIGSMSFPGCTPTALPATPALSIAPSPPAALTAGSPSGAMTVNRTLSGSAYSPSTAAQVTLTTTSGTGGFDTASNGTFSSPSLTVTIPAGASASNAFYFQDTTTGQPTITAGSAGYTSGSQSQTVNPGPLSTITVNPSYVAAAIGDTVAYSATGADAYNNAVSITPTWAVDQAIGTFSPNPGASTSLQVTAATGATANVSATVGSIVGTATIDVSATPNND